MLHLETLTLIRDVIVIALLVLGVGERPRTIHTGDVDGNRRRRVCGSRPGRQRRRDQPRYRPAAPGGHGSRRQLSGPEPRSWALRA